MTRQNKRNKISKHHSSYDIATERALRCIYDGCNIKVDGQEYSYNKQRNELIIKDFYGVAIYKPKFINGFCDPFFERVTQEL